MNCREMGGPCDHEITASTPDEMIEKFHQHVMSMTDEGHIKLTGEIKVMTEEEVVNWRYIFMEKWNSVSEVTA